ncbi:hypothetical protein GTW29_02165 [Streptomyces sp. SID7834]|nr:hypothetical protein [Streptomyces sp. SID7834]
MPASAQPPSAVPPGFDGTDLTDCNQLGISVARRASVALMDAHVGPKY